jgi:hypothetical protein
MAACPEKRGYPNRMAAETALGVARNQWKRNPSRAAEPPNRVYLCPRCDRYHLTHSSYSGA